MSPLARGSSSHDGAGWDAAGVVDPADGEVVVVLVDGVTGGVATVGSRAVSGAIYVLLGNPGGGWDGWDCVTE